MSSTRRSLTSTDIAEFERIRAERPCRTVRVYSSAGFVPRSYRWRCDIEFIEYRDCYPEGRVTRGWTQAQRSYGAGDLVVVR